MGDGLHNPRMQLSTLFPKLLLFGDSIVERSVQTPAGLIPELQKQYVGKYDVVNRGFSGYTSEAGVQIEKSVFQGLGPAPVEWTLLGFGTDENANSTDALLPFVSATNLNTLASTAIQSAHNVVIIGPGVINEDLVNGSNYNFYEYSQMARNVAALYNLPFVDMWSVFRTFLDESPDVLVGSGGDFVPLVLLNDSASNSTFGNSVNQSSFNISAFVEGYYNGTNLTTANGTVLSNSSSTNNGASSSSGNGSSSGNDAGTSSYTYVGERGNPANWLLDSILIDGVHYTDLGYQLMLDALLPVLNLTSPTSVLPDNTLANTTRELPFALAEGFVSAAKVNGALHLAFANDSLSGLAAFD